MLEGDQLTAFHKELDLIQDCIKRMANNSFLIKGWTITYIGGVLALFNGELSDWFLAFLILFGVATFWLLDAFFLQTEKAYRELYKEVVSLRSKGDFENAYCLDASKHRKRVGSLLYVAMSKTLWPLYGIPFAIALIACVVQIVKKADLLIDCLSYVCHGTL